MMGRNWIFIQSKRINIFMSLMRVILHVTPSDGVFGILLPLLGFLTKFWMDGYGWIRLVRVCH